MLGEVQSFQKGTIYRIINRKTKRCLSSSQKDVLSSPLEEVSEQMWIIQSIKSDEMSIVQMKTGEVLTRIQGKSQIKLQKGKMKSGQLWSLEKAQSLNQTQYFWIKPIKEKQASLCASALNEKIKVSTVDPTLQICLWEIKPCELTGPLFKELSVFKSQLTKLVLDVPEYSTKEGVGVVQYLAHGGGNQRWIIGAYENQNEGFKQFTIKNYCSGLFLTASFYKLGFKATQTIFNCGPDQRWKLLRMKDNIFLLQSVSNESYYLGVNSEKGGSFVTMTQQVQKSHWIIEGYYPST